MLRRLRLLAERVVGNGRGRISLPLGAEFLWGLQGREAESPSTRCRHEAIMNKSNLNNQALIVVGLADFPCAFSMRFLLHVISQFLVRFLDFV